MDVAWFRPARCWSLLLAVRTEGSDLLAVTAPRPSQRWRDRDAGDDFVLVTLLTHLAGTESWPATIPRPGQ